MGITGFFPFIKDKVPESVTPFKWSDWKGKRIAIDSSGFLYPALSGMRESDFTLVDDPETGQCHYVDHFDTTTNHIRGMFSKCCFILSQGCWPVVILEGKAPDQKREEIMERTKKKEAALAKQKIAMLEGNYAEMIKNAQQSVSVTDRHKKDIEKLMQLMGIPTIQAPFEGESQCSFLCREGMVDAVLSEDADVLIFGAPTLLRNTSFSLAESKKRKRTGDPEVVSLAPLLKGLGFNKVEELIDMSILFGCDYPRKIAGIGPVNAFKMIKEYKTLEQVTAHVDRKKHFVPDNWTMDNIPVFRRYFTHPVVMPKEECITKLVWSPIKREELVSWMVKDVGMTNCQQWINTCLDTVK